MEVYKVVLDGILTIMRRPIMIGGFTFSLFGLVVVSAGASMVGIILKAIFGDD